MPLPLIILFIVFFAISIRKIGPLSIPIWLSMSGGAITVLVAQQITFKDAFLAIDWNTIGYLIGVFIIAQGLEESKLTYIAGNYLFKHTQTMRVALFLMIFISGLLSAIFMNDTIAIVATPLLISFAKKNNLNVKSLLLLLAMSITIGSVLSPIGNPQNLLIATKSNIPDPFGYFLKNLGIPTLLSLLLCYLFFCLFYYKKILKVKPALAPTKISDHQLSFLCKISIILMSSLILIKIIIGYISPKIFISFSMITLTACLPLIIFSKQRLTIVKGIDWRTLVFFIAMFILMQSVWNTHVLQHSIKSNHIMIQHIPTIILISVIFSQIISNVPVVALYLPLLIHHSATIQQILALAVGSTLAGNFLILGAASNIIIIQNAHKSGEEAFTLWEFMRIGVPLGICCLIIFWICL